MAPRAPMRVQDRAFHDLPGWFASRDRALLAAFQRSPGNLVWNINFLIASRKVNSDNMFPTTFLRQLILRISFAILSPGSFLRQSGSQSLPSELPAPTPVAMRIGDLLCRPTSGATLNLLQLFSAPNTLCIESKVSAVEGLQPKTLKKRCIEKHTTSEI